MSHKPNIAIFYSNLPQPLMEINSHENRGYFPFPSWLIPIPTFCLILVPFPWDYHESPIPMGILTPMHTSCILPHVHDEGNKET